MEKYLADIITGLIILFGAIVHATAKLKIARDTKNESFTKIDFIILIPIAVFSGMLFAFVASLFFEGEIIIRIMASVGAFLGLSGLNKLSQALLDILVTRATKK